MILQTLMLSSCVGAASGHRIHGKSVFLQARHHIDCLRYAESRCSRWDSCIILHVWFAECGILLFHTLLSFIDQILTLSILPKLYGDGHRNVGFRLHVQTFIPRTGYSHWMMPAYVSWWWGLMGYLHCRQEAFRWGHDFPFLRIPACISLATLSNHGIPNCKKNITTTTTSSNKFASQGNHYVAGLSNCLISVLFHKHNGHNGHHAWKVSQLPRWNSIGVLKRPGLPF